MSSAQSEMIHFWIRVDQHWINLRHKPGLVIVDYVLSWNKTSIKNKSKKNFQFSNFFPEELGLFDFQLFLVPRFFKVVFQLNQSTRRPTLGIFPPTIFQNWRLIDFQCCSIPEKFQKALIQLWTTLKTQKFQSEKSALNNAVAALISSETLLKSADCSRI